MDEPSRNAYQAIHFAVDARYRLVKRLGQGTYGTVCSAQDLKSEDQHLIAVKKVNNIFNREVLVRRALRELRLMRCLRGHRNIVSLIDLDYVTKAPYDGLYCYQELMDFDLINVIRGPIELTNLHLQSFMYQLLCGVKYIHSGKVIHRDLKPGNLLVSRDGVVKICDFGLARGMNYDLNDKTQITAYVATRWYRAPELIMSYRNYTEAIDIWAVGCIFGELLGRHPLFQGQNPMDQLKKICKVVGIPSKPVLDRMGIKKTWEVLESNMPQYTGIPYSKLFPDADFAALDLIGKLLRFDPTKRVSAVGALRHKYLANFQNSSSEAIMTSPVDFNFESLSFENLKAELEEEVRGFRREVRGIPPGGAIHPHRLYHQDYIHTR